MKDKQGATGTDPVEFPSSVQHCSDDKSSPSSRDSGHSLLLLQLRTELEGKWRPDKFGILRRWMNVTPKHWFCQKEDAYDYALRPAMIIRNVKKSNGQTRARKKQARNPARSKTTLIDRFVQQVSPIEENEKFVDCRCDSEVVPSEKNQRRARRFLLEEEVMLLQKRLQREVDLHLALENAVTFSGRARPRRPHDIPIDTREMLADIAALEDVVAALEEQSTALQHEIGQERKERVSFEQRDSPIPSTRSCCEQKTSPAAGAEGPFGPSRPRQIPGSRRTKTTTSSATVQQQRHSEPVVDPKFVPAVITLEDHLRCTLVARATQPSSPCAHCRAFRRGDTFVPAAQSTCKTSQPVQTNGLSPLVWKPSASSSDSTSSQEMSISKVSSDNSSSNKYAVLSAVDPHNRVQSSVAPLQADSSAAMPFSLSPPRDSYSGASTSDLSDPGAPTSAGREQDLGSSSPFVSDFSPLPTSPSTPEHRVRPTSPAGAGLLPRVHCDDARTSEDGYLKQLSRSSSAWGTYTSEEYYTPKTSCSGLGDHLSGDSQASSAEKRSKVRVKLNLQPDDNSMILKKPNFLEKGLHDEGATRRSLIYDLLSPGLQLDIFPMNYPGGGRHDKNQYRGYSQTPNLLSEEMIKCMVSIYWHLADPAVIIRNRSFDDNIPSPTSNFEHSFSSFSESSLLSFVRSPLVDLRSKDDILGRQGSPDPYKVRGRIPWADIGMYSKVLEVPWMSVSTDQLGYAAQALYKFRLLVEQLPEVDPRCMSHSQKLAFWLNLYNSLMMHGYLAYGIPRNDLKYYAFLLKAAYNVGGHLFNAATIEYSLLRGKSPSYRPQIGLLLALHRSKWSLTEEQSNFAIDYPEPQLIFSLCCGARSSPAVRVYTAGQVHKEMSMALRDYARATVGMNGKGKLLVPRLLYTYAHEFVDDWSLLDWICQFLPANQAGLVQECWQHRQNRLLGARKFAVLPFELNFRYLFAPIFYTSADLY